MEAAKAEMERREVIIRSREVDVASLQQRLQEMAAEADEERKQIDKQVHDALEDWIKMVSKNDDFYFVYHMRVKFDLIEL